MLPRVGTAGAAALHAVGSGDAVMGVLAPVLLGPPAAAAHWGDCAAGQRGGTPLLPRCGGSEALPAQRRSPCRLPDLQLLLSSPDALRCSPPRCTPPQARRRGRPAWWAARRLRSRRGGRATRSFAFTSTDAQLVCSWRVAGRHGAAGGRRCSVQPTGPASSQPAVALLPAAVAQASYIGEPGGRLGAARLHTLFRRCRTLLECLKGQVKGSRFFAVLLSARHLECWAWWLQGPPAAGLVQALPAHSCMASSASASAAAAAAAAVTTAAPSSCPLLSWCFLASASAAASLPLPAEGRGGGGQRAGGSVSGSARLASRAAAATHIV